MLHRALLARLASTLLRRPGPTKTPGLRRGPRSGWRLRARSWASVLPSLWLALARMFVVIPITLFLAWAITRTNMPLRRVLEGLIVSHIFLPFLPLVMSWAVLASPRAGLVNVGLRNVLGLPQATGPL